MSFFEQALAAPLANFDAFHELLNFVILFFYFVAYASLLQKLRQEKGAVHVSLQMLFAFVFTEINRVALLVVAYYEEFTSQLRIAQLFCRCVTCIMSIIAYRAALRHVKVVDWDSFGEIMGNKSPRKPGDSASSSGFRVHWLTLYTIAFLGGLVLQFARRQTPIPTWYGLHECFVALQHNSSPSHFVPDMMGALQLLPQLHLIWIRKKHISSALARFAGFMMLARLTSLIYWISDVYFHGALTGRGIHIISDSLNVLILSYFAIRFISRRGIHNICLPV